MGDSTGSLTDPKETQPAEGPDQDPTPPETPAEHLAQPGDGIVLISEEGEEFQLPASTKIRLKYRQSPLDLTLDEASKRFQEGYHNQKKAETLAAERKAWEQSAGEYQNYLQWKGWLEADPQAFQVVQLMATNQVRPEQMLQALQGNQQPPSNPQPGTPNGQDPYDAWFDEGPGAAPSAPNAGAPTQQGLPNQMPPYLNPLVQGMNMLVDKVTRLEQQREQEANEQRQTQLQQRMQRQADEILDAIDKSQLPDLYGETRDQGLQIAAERVGAMLKADPSADPLLAVRTLESELMAGRKRNYDAGYQQHLQRRAAQAQRGLQPVPGLGPQHPQVPDFAGLPTPQPGDLQSGQVRRNVMGLLRKALGGGG